MIRTYRWILHSDAVEAFQALPKRKRERLIRAFNLLAAHPFQTPKARSLDSEGGEISTIFEGEIAIAYDVDHAVRQVHIFRIDREKPLS